MKNSIKGDLSGDLNLQTDFMQIGVLNKREYTLPVIQCSTEKSESASTLLYFDSDS